MFKHLKSFPLWVLEVCGVGFYFGTKQECIQKRDKLISSGEYHPDEFLIYFESELLKEIVK